MGASELGAKLLALEPYGDELGDRGPVAVVLTCIIGELLGARELGAELLALEMYGDEMYDPVPVADVAPLADALVE